MSGKYKNRRLLVEYLNTFISRIIKLNFIKLALSAVIIIWCSTLAFMALDAAFSPGHRFIILYRCVTLIAAFFFCCAYFYTAIYKSPSVIKAARYIEKLDPCRGNYLSTAVELETEDIEKYGFSAPLYESTVETAAAHYLNKDFKRYINYSVLKKLSYAVIILFFASVITALEPGALKRLNKIWPSVASLFMPAPLIISSSNRDFISYIDEDIEFNFSFNRHEALELYILHTSDNRKDPYYKLDYQTDEKNEYIKVFKLFRDDNKNKDEFIYKLKIPSPAHNFYYRARSLTSESSSDTFFVTSRKRPEILKLNAAYEFPAYTGIAPMIEENASTINALYMSTIELTAYSNAAIKKAELIFSDGRRLAMKLNEKNKSASVKFKALKKDAYKIELVDIYDTFNREGRFYDINVYDDRYPSCEIIDPTGIINAPHDRKIDITIKAKDDFAISKIIAAYYKTPEYEKTFEIILQEKNAAEIFAKSTIDFNDINFKPGESLFYYAISYDNDKISGPKSTRSAVNKIVFPTQFEEAVELEALYGSIENRLNKITNDQKAIAERIEKMEILKKQNAMNDYELKKNFESIARSQQNLINEAEKLTSDLKDAIKKMENNVYIKPETLAKITEIQKQLEDVLSNDMKRLMSEINKNIEKTKFTDEDLKKFSKNFDEKKLIEKFERLKELFSKAEKEQKLITFIKEIEDILSKQEAITENTEKASPELTDLNSELASEQRRISDNYEKAFSNFEKNIQAIGEISENIKDAVKKTHNNLKTEDAGGYLKKAAGDLEKNSPDNAFTAQNKASDSLKTNIEALKTAFDNFKKDNKKELLEAVSKLLSRARAMAAFENEIMDGFSTVQSLIKPSTNEKFVETLDGISENCLELSNVSREITGELIRLSKKTILIDSNHIAITGSILRQFTDIKPLLAKRDFTEALNISRQIYYNITIFNLMLLDIYDILLSSKSGSNMDQLMAMIKKQADAQARLNAKTKDMMKRAGENGMPQISDDALKSLAFEQQMIRRSLERIMDSSEGDSETEKRLRELQSEMRNLEVEYLKKKVDSKIVSRQKVLHERLIDMQQALFKEKQTTERKAERAKNYAPASPAAPLEAIKINGRSLKLEDAIKNEKYPVSYEKLIELYFEAVKKF